MAYRWFIWCFQKVFFLLFLFSFFFFFFCIQFQRAYTNSVGYLTYSPSAPLNTDDVGKSTRSALCKQRNKSYLWELPRVSYVFRITLAIEWFLCLDCELLELTASQRKAFHKFSLLCGLIKEDTFSHHFIICRVISYCEPWNTSTRWPKYLFRQGDI